MPAPHSQLNPVWHTGGGHNSRRGLHPQPAHPQAPPARSLPAHGAVQASVVFDAHNRAFLMDMAGWTQAFDSHGTLLWEQSLQGAISATGALDLNHELVFAATLAGHVYALETLSGKIHWQTRIPTQTDARILSDLLFLPRHQQLILHSWGGHYHALHTQDGRSLGTWDAGLFPYAGAAADQEENVYCLRAVSEQGIELLQVTPQGRETVLHQHAAPNLPARRQRITAAPVLDESRHTLYVILNTGPSALLQARSLAHNTVLWQKQFDRSILATPALAKDGSVLVADMTGHLHFLAPDGSEQSRLFCQTDYLPCGPVVDETRRVFLGDPLGQIHTVAPDGTSTLLWEAPRAIQARPSFDSAGNLYVPATNRQVYVFAQPGS